jgi:hypothetical protein
MDGWCNANFQCRSIARGYGVHMNLDHESMKRILTRVTTIWQNSKQWKAAYEYKVFKITHHMALVGLWHIKQELSKRVFNFLNKIPKYSNI